MTEVKSRLKKVEIQRYELDVRGLVCPLPQVLVSKALKTISPEDFLDVFIDNPPSVRDIPLVLETGGYKTEVEKIDKITWKLCVQTRG